MNRIRTGIAKLDNILRGGFPENTVVLLSGGPGSGKTLFGLNFLINGIDDKTRCCYISFNESKDELLRACSGIESLKSVKKILDKNLAIISLNLGEEIDVDKFIDIISSYPKLDKLVMDNINKLLMFSEDRKDYRINLYKLVKFLKERVKCSILICETKNDGIDSGNGEGFECDGIIKLLFSEFEERPVRTLEIHKMRYTSFAPKISHEFVINDKELDITETRIL